MSLLCLAILSLYNILKRFDFSVFFRYKEMLGTGFVILFIFALFSPLKNLDVFYNPLKTTQLVIPNFNFLVDNGTNYGSGDMNPNNGVPDGWDLGDWSPKKPAVMLELSSEHYKENGKSLVIKTLNSPARFKLRSGLITISSYKRLSIQSYIKKESGLSPFFRIAFFDRDFNMLTEMQGIKYFKGFEDWRLAKFECMVPRDSCYVQLSLAVWGDVDLNRKIWIESISLYGRK